MLKKETMILDRYLKLPYSSNGGERVETINSIRHSIGDHNIS